MARLIRVDAELVRRGLASSRRHAQELVESGLVRLSGETVRKSARQMDPAQPLLVVEGERDEYVSRGARKLAGALDALGEAAPAVASTGGFTDVLLRRGAGHVVAVDVGYGQIAWRLREDPRVTVLERTNVRTLDPAAVAPAPGLVVGDLSFISLTLVIPSLVRAAAAEADFLLLVKPQFEVGRERLGAGGVVRDTRLHAETVMAVSACARSHGLDVLAAIASPLPGPAGNVEYFLHMRAGSGQEPDGGLESAVRSAIATGPAGKEARK
mgnify:CR=1 FL=1